VVQTTVAVLPDRVTQVLMAKATQVLTVRVIPDLLMDNRVIQGLMAKVILVHLMDKATMDLPMTVTVRLWVTVLTNGVHNVGIIRVMTMTAGMTVQETGTVVHHSRDVTAAGTRVARAGIPHQEAEEDNINRE
jgi:hypothetical protein